jgi:hypothetical protein
MAPLTLERKAESWLDDHARRWVSAGIISAEQADGIKNYEQVADERPPQRLGIAAEVAAYVGSVLALMGGLTVVGPNWEDMALAGRVGVGVAVMAIGFISGRWIMKLGEAGATRLGSFLWAVGTGGIAIAMAAVMQEIEPEDEAVTAIAIGIPIMAVSLGLWRNLDRPLQVVAAAIGFAVTTFGLVELADVSPWVAGVVFLAFGAAVAIGAISDLVKPRLVALGVGSFGAYIGGFMLGDLNEHVGPAVALLVAIAATAFALRDRLIPLLVAGVVGALIATQALLATTFSGAVAALVVTLLGIVIVGVTIARTVRGGDRA